MWGKGTAEGKSCRPSEKLRFHSEDIGKTLEGNLGVEVLSSCGVEKELWGK